jgi:hypothetical protein
MKSRIISSVLFVCLIGFLSLYLSGCKKTQDEAQVNIKIYDARDSQSANKNTSQGIIDENELSKCEVEFSSIQFKNTDGEWIELLSETKTIDLLNFQGTAHTLLSSYIPVGSYSHIKIIVSGVSTTYKGNNYTAAVNAQASVAIGGSINISTGVPNVFDSGEISFEYPLSFTLDNESDIENIHLQFDINSSLYEIIYTHSSVSYVFAGLRPFVNIGIILEQGIQQIRHSPPYGITIVSMDAVDYYGIHTFVDFHSHGGTITAHTSQHVYRGADGSLTIDAEQMAVNNNPLSPSEIAATGETDVRSDETFNYSGIISNLSAAGHTLLSGNTYYFSLRKKWTITTNGSTYELTRMCEPIPVIIP